MCSIARQGWVKRDGQRCSSKSNLNTEGTEVSASKSCNDNLPQRTQRAQRKSEKMTDYSGVSAKRPYNSSLFQILITFLELLSAQRKTNRGNYFAGDPQNLSGMVGEPRLAPTTLRRNLHDFAGPTSQLYSKWRRN